MKKLFLLFFAVINYTSAFSQIDSVTYGISALTQGSGLYLSKINVADGNIAKISPDAALLSPGLYGRTIDPLHHLYYYVNGSGLLAFDLNTGELIRKISITNYLNSTFHGISYNYPDSSLYGIAVDAAGLNVKLAKLDPYTGAVTPVSDSSLATTYNVLTGTALDPVHGLYYFTAINNTAYHLIGADLHSGKLTSDRPIGIAPGDRFGPMEYNCHDSSLYALAGNYIHGRKLARINPYDGVVTLLSKFNVADTILNEYVTIDPFQQVYYFEATDHTYRGVNINSGDLVSMSPITPFTGSYFTGFLFNHICYVHSPSSIAEPNTDAGLTIFPNPVSDQLNIRSTAPLYKVEILDFTGRSVFTEHCRGLKEFQADLSGVREGIYILRMSTGTTSASREFVKVAPGIQPGH
ncbi:MAG: T9SS type A sorting domain-containing protein [Bacteroidales bacterium]